MKKTNIKTETYALTGGFMIDIVTKDDLYEAYLYHRHNGIKSLMFGSMKDQETYKDFIETVELNADEYIMDYAEDYMDGGYCCQLYVAERESGKIIEPVDDISDGIDMIVKIEKCDSIDGSYKPDAYDIVTDNGYSVLVGE